MFTMRIINYVTRFAKSGLVLTFKFQLKGDVTWLIIELHIQLELIFWMTLTTTELLLWFMICVYVRICNNIICICIIYIYKYTQTYMCSYIIMYSYTYLHM